MTGLFTRHPASVGESYGEHLRVASGFGIRLIFAGFACLLHGIFPFICIRTGSRCVNQLHARMAHRTPSQATQATQASLPASRPATAPNTTAVARPIAGR